MDQNDITHQAPGLIYRASTSPDDNVGQDGPVARYAREVGTQSDYATLGPQSFCALFDVWKKSAGCKSFIYLMHIARLGLRDEGIDTATRGQISLWSTACPLRRIFANLRVGEGRHQLIPILPAQSQKLIIALAALDIRIDA